MPKRQLIFFDFEVVKGRNDRGWWCVTFALPMEDRIVQIWDDREALLSFYNDYPESVYIGYNCKDYDQWIFKAILAGFNAYEMNKWIIHDGKQGWQFSDVLRRFPIIVFDCMGRNDPSLKTFEGYMGDNIEESSVDFMLERELTDEEIEDILYYNRHDVLETMEVFKQRHLTNDPQINFLPKIMLINLFKCPLDWLSKTSTRLTSLILGAKKQEFHDEWEVVFPSCLKIDKYRAVVDWFKSEESHKEKASLDIEIAGVPCTFAWGGLHGAIPSLVVKDNSIIDADVTSMYPNIMEQFDLFSRALDEKGKKNFHDIKVMRAEAKKSGNKAIANAFKIMINSIFGASGDPTSELFDPRNAHSVCMTGQLLILDLVEHLEDNVPNIRFCQLNTDGIFFTYDNTQETFDRIDDVIYEWERRTGLVMEFSDFRSLYQANVNNYVAVESDGGVIRKGGTFKKSDFKNGQLPIIQECVTRYFTEGVTPEEIIFPCDDLMMFQNVLRLTSKFRYATTKISRINGRMMGDESGRVPYRTLRIFASSEPDGGTLYKVNALGQAKSWDDTPASIFIDNGDVKGKPVPWNLDKMWYVHKAWETIRKLDMIWKDSLI